MVMPTEFSPTVISALVGAFIFVQLTVCLYLALTLRSANRQRTKLERELFGLVKKIEGLTATKREQMVRHYDGMLETLERKLPHAVAAQTSEMIFQTESQILTKLADLEPSITVPEQREQMDELIQSMEQLHETIVVTASDAVRKVITENRSRLFEDEDQPLALKRSDIDSLQ